MTRTDLIRLSLVGALLVGVVGCGSNVQYVQMDPTQYEEKPSAENIEVHRSSVIKPHVVLGVATVSQKMEANTKTLSTYETLIEDLKTKARKVGGDALVEVKPVYDSAAVDTKVALQAKVIRYLEHQNSVTAQ